MPQYSGRQSQLLDNFDDGNSAFSGDYKSVHSVPRHCENLAVKMDIHNLRPCFKVCCWRETQKNGSVPYADDSKH